MADFIEAEEVVRKFFPKGTTFDYEGEEYMVIDSGKPLVVELKEVGDI